MPAEDEAVPGPGQPGQDAASVDDESPDSEEEGDDSAATGGERSVESTHGEMSDVLAPEEIQQFEADLAALQRERDEWLDTTKRLQADFENYRKRVVREQTALVERASEGLVEQLLPVLDNFELTLQNVDASADEQIRKGVELVYADLIAVLEKNGLERIDALGAPFDPNEHEAVMQEDGDGEPIVGQVLRTGWKLKGRVLRPSMVKVSKQ
jgi:molecular chaperone GrpE